ncbi:MAG: methylated-DNA--[protein]-cysteine S-methyltransferase [Holosporaceae bacterium]|jgi:methylated-DNA-[protein]-cysteine S-methyltransferase|nr:methylated-DNA--[protein]-cysteine S-methyltransferase [Holosporaceae bacterium]
MNYFSYETTIGNIAICADRRAVTRVCFDRSPDIDAEKSETSLIKEAHTQLDEYLAGFRKQFEIELEYNGSNFQLSVWEELKKIPYGETKSYKEIAHKIDNPNSCLAVGGACGKNPIPIFIPCHRVIGSNGSLIGYRGGVNLKKKLLELERIHAANPSF